MRALAPAKVNLVLRVGPRRPDGYHELATLLVALDAGDVLELEPAPATTVEAPGLPGGDTLVTDALGRLAEAARHGAGWAVRIEKRVPAGAGLGGGSSDAGTALRLANATLARPLPAGTLVALAAAVGSDVPFFAAGFAAAVATGRGEALRAVPLAARPHVVVAWPGTASSTAAVYAAYRPARSFDGAVEEAAAAAAAGLADLPRRVRNDLGAAAEAVSPGTATLREELAARGSLAAAVAGSGSAAFGLFASRDVAERAAAGLPGAAWTAVAPPWAGATVTA